jgi:hypothetical protein
VDLFLVSGTTVVSFDTTDNLGDDAVAAVQAPFTGTFNIAISLCAGPPPTLMKWMASFGSASSIEYDTKSSTSWGHKNQEFTAGVGAAFFTNTPEFGQDPPLLEPFSSRGGTPVLFEVDGTRKTEPRVLEQPRFVATDGCINTFFGQVDNFPPNGIGSYFFGTSAAAPNAAAVAILMLQANPNLTPTELYTILQETAIDMKTPGFDFDSGFGYIDALAAVEAATSPTTSISTSMSTSTSTPPEETTTSTSTTTPPEETTSTTSTPPGIVGTSFSCFNVGDLDPFNVTDELGNTGADGLKDILEYHNTFVADACETILNMIDDVDCVSNYEELMCSLEAGYDDIDVCANSVIEFPLYIGTGSDVRSTAYAAPVLTLPKKFKMNCPSCNCGFARKFAFPILDQLAPFCPFFGVGIDSKYTIEGFTYFTSIPEGPDDVIIDEVDPANNVFELLYNKTLETPSQFNVFNMNSFTSDSAEDRDMLGNLTTIKTKAESKATTKCGSRGRRRAIAKFDFDEGFYDSVVDGNARRLVGVVDTTKMSKSNRKQLRTGRLQEVEAVEEGDLLFCNDTFYEANYTTYIYPPEYAATVVGPDVTESTAAQYIIKAWDANGDGFVNCTESMMKCNEFLAKYGATEVTVDTFFSLFTP